ncbi:hypothetical protein MNV49_003564 [Pseudohyphozyma bogoriensis]|nr:hypothetical protein MNV49_003564 [Pseudohyphozyma bogoriensis]
MSATGTTLLLPALLRDLDVLAASQAQLPSIEPVNSPHPSPSQLPPSAEGLSPKESVLYAEAFIASSGNLLARADESESLGTRIEDVLKEARDVERGLRGT